jgi:hypothetical protein
VLLHVHFSGAMVAAERYGATARPHLVRPAHRTSAPREGLGRCEASLTFGHAHFQHSRCALTYVCCCFVVREPEENLAGAAEMLREFRQQLQQRRETGEGGGHSSDSDDDLVEEPPRNKQKLERAAAAATASNVKRKHQGKH